MIGRVVFGGFFSLALLLTGCATTPEAGTMEEAPAGDTTMDTGIRQEEPAMPGVGESATQGGRAAGGTMGMARGGAMGMCPTQLTGTRVDIQDTSDGAALVFTTSGDVSELRRRVQFMADKHNQRHAGGGMMGGGMRQGAGPHGGMMGGGMGGMQGGRQMMMLPNSRASVEEIPGGARLVFVPTSTDDLGTLRERLRMHAERMRMGECPMLMEDEGEPSLQDTDEGTNQTP